MTSPLLAWHRRRKKGGEGLERQKSDWWNIFLGKVTRKIMHSGIGNAVDIEAFRELLRTESAHIREEGREKRHRD